jgi:hypothetical protein
MLSSQKGLLEVEPTNKGNTLGLEKYKKADKLTIIVYLISSGRSSKRLI